MPGDLGDEQVAKLRELCERVVSAPPCDADGAPDDCIFTVAEQIPAVALGDASSAASTNLYVVWSLLDDLSDREERRGRADQLMRNAAREFLQLTDYTDQLDAYLSRWTESLAP